MSNDDLSGVWTLLMCFGIIPMGLAFGGRLLYWLVTSAGRPGALLDEWGAFVAERAELVADVAARVLAIMRDRGLRNLKIGEAVITVGPAVTDLGALVRMLAERGYPEIVFQQHYPKGGTATVTLLIQPRGKDIALAWKLFGKNSTVEFLLAAGQGTVLSVGFFLCTATVMFLVTPLFPICGLAACTVLGAGLGWVALSARQPSALKLDQFEGAMLARTVDYALMKAARDLGIAAHEIRVGRTSKMPGVGAI